MTFKYRYRKQIIIGIILLIIISSTITYFIINKKDKKEKEIVLEKKPLKKKEKKEENKIEYKVDIKGQINNPGIYTLDSNSRVIDVIEKAGGLTENANTSVINLSKKINDEMVIIIYSNDEVKEFEKTKEKEELVQKKCRENEIYSLENDACISTQKEQSSTNSKVSINTASKEELMTLQGIGESKAKDIISYRETNGSFTNIEDIKKVPGIGDVLFAQIKENITI